MKIYLAGIPGGNQREREQRIIRIGGHLRLSSFYYLKQLMVTMQEIFNEDIFSGHTGHDFQRRAINKTNF